MISKAASAALPAEFEIQKVLGSGANGLVYLAKDGAGQLCALKEFAVSADIAQKFFREASMVFTLVHDNIVRCQNLLYGKGGRSFLVFEYVPGGTLRDYLEAHNTLTPHEALDLLRQLCLGLGHAHEANILHCDLKPENILLAPNGESMTFKIADLGIARYSAEAADAQGTAGSPAYMAPEQFYGRSDARSDIYSLGVILFEALAGQRPFEGPPARLFALHSHEQPDLSLIADTDCVRLLTLLLAKQPAARPANCAEIISSIDAILNPEIIADANNSTDDAPEAEVAEANAPLEQRGPAFSIDLPGTHRMFPLFTGVSQQLLVSDGKSTDMVDAQSQRVRPHFLPEFILAADGETDGQSTLIATNRSIRMFENGTTRLLFPHQTSVAAIAHDAARGRVIMASMKRIHCLTAQGTALWQADAPNYSRPPALLATSTGEVIFTTGPIFPTIRIASQSGVVRSEIATTGPVLALREEEEGSFSAVIQGLGADAPSRFARYAGTTLEREVELGTGIYHAAWHGNLLSLHFTDGHIQLLGQNLTPLWEHRCEGVPLADAWQPRLQKWVVLERTAGSVCLRSFKLTPSHLEAPTV
jgi:serine/threonine protein kinase